jgi:hypothetical protein
MNSFNCIPSIAHFKVSSDTVAFFKVMFSSTVLQMEFLHMILSICDLNWLRLIFLKLLSLIEIARLG